MNASPLPASSGHIRDYYRPLILSAAALILLYFFWVTSRYPSLLDKASHVDKALPSMAYSKALFAIEATAPLWQKIVLGALNWLDGMKIGMSFGVLFGALVHTYLRYYPMRIGRNLYLNSMKGALVGLPMGVCANCAVPIACGLTRGNGRIEVALGFLFSSPNFNPVVLTMTMLALPLSMSLTKYAVLLAMIGVVVPYVIGRLERDKPLLVQTSKTEMIAEPAPEMGGRRFPVAFKEVALDYASNVWMLFKPTITIMLIGSVVASALLALIPWSSLLAEVTPLRLILVSLISTFMPVPIALDVMFSSQLLKQGIDPGYAMIFAMSLGTYSIIPSIYLWREVSKRLAVILFLFFWLTGLLCGVIF